MSTIEINEYDLIYNDGGYSQQSLLKGEGWYIQETPSGRVSQRFRSREEALDAFEGDRLNLMFIH